MDFQSVDHLKFWSDTAGHQWGMDNFTYTPVPEPGTLLAAGWLIVPFGFQALRSLREQKKP